MSVRVLYPHSDTVSILWVKNPQISRYFFHFPTLEPILNAAARTQSLFQWIGKWKRNTAKDIVDIRSKSPAFHLHFNRSFAAAVNERRYIKFFSGVLQNPFCDRTKRFTKYIFTVVFCKPDTQLMQSFFEGRKAGLLILSTIIGKLFRELFLLYPVRKQSSCHE